MGLAQLSEAAQYVLVHGATITHGGTVYKCIPEGGCVISHHQDELGCHISTICYGMDHV